MLSGLSSEGIGDEELEEDRPTLETTKKDGIQSYHQI